MKSHTHSVVLIAGLCLVGRAALGDDPAARRPRLNALDPVQVWRATSPALLEGRTPEVLEQLGAVFSETDPANRPEGWYHASQPRFTWGWLSRSFDTNGDGAVSADELGISPKSTEWARLDRDRNGAVRKDDLDWSEQSPWVRQDRAANQRFNAMDADANGRISEEEWRAFFANASEGKDHVTADDLRDNLLSMPARQARPLLKFPERWDRAVVILNGDIGSMFEGPKLNHPAPGFSLETSHGDRRYTLSDYRGKKPVVLIFGSFT